jgi:hypothetical protein
MRLTLKGRFPDYYSRPTPKNNPMSSELAGMRFGEKKNCLVKDGLNPKVPPWQSDEKNRGRLWCKKVDSSL